MIWPLKETGRTLIVALGEAGLSAYAIAEALLKNKESCTVGTIYRILHENDIWLRRFRRGEDERSRAVVSSAVRRIYGGGRRRRSNAA